MRTQDFALAKMFFGQSLSMLGRVHKIFEIRVTSRALHNSQKIGNFFKNVTFSKYKMRKGAGAQYVDGVRQNFLQKELILRAGSIHVKSHLLM